jgi:tRNA threonylcarbamoyladenosine biosynthesis protein TsaB
MLVLVVDTSGRFGSIALGRCDAESPCRILEVVALEGGTFSAELVPQIASLLVRFDLTKNNLDAFVVVTGPGSFTGLRIGLAVIKALAETLGKPIAAVSLLEMIAAQAGMNGRITVALDAGRKEIYRGEYEIKEGAETLPAMIREELLTQDEFVSGVSGTVVTPEAAIAELARGAGISVQEIPRPDASCVLPIGWKKIQRQILVSPEELEANYIRRTDAKVLASPK